MLFADSSVSTCAITLRHVCFLYGINSRKLRAKVIVNRRISYGKELSSLGRVQSCVEGLEGNRERSSKRVFFLTSYRYSHKQ